MIKVVIMASPMPISICTNTMAGKTILKEAMPDKTNSMAQQAAAKTIEHQLLIATAGNIFLGLIFLMMT